MKSRRLDRAIASTLILTFISLSAPVAAESVGHKIRKGETLWKLAMRHRTSVRKIAHLNGINPHAILREGRYITIPTDKATSSNYTDTKGSEQEQVVSSTQQQDKPELIRTALACRGARYRRGGTSRGGFDCSGFTRYVFAKYGISLPHSSAAQSRLGKPVPKGDLREGDLVFFHTRRAGISHVGIYVGNNQFVHAATYGRGVRVDSLSSSYYGPRYRCARRVRET